MNESFALLSEVLELSTLSSQKALIIVLNKLDLFKEKMASIETAQAFKSFFTEYKGMTKRTSINLVLIDASYAGELEWEAASNFLRKRFIDMVKPRTVFVHITSALDTDAVNLIWKDVRGITVKQLLAQSMSI